MGTNKNMLWKILQITAFICTITGLSIFGVISYFRNSHHSTYINGNIHPANPTHSLTNNSDSIQEQYNNAIKLLDGNHYKAAIEILRSISEYESAKLLLYDIAIDREVFGDYYLAVDIYYILGCLYHDVKERYDYIINNYLPIEFYVGAWIAEDNDATYEFITYRDSQNNYYAEIYHKPKEPDSHRNQLRSAKCIVTYDESKDSIVATHTEWINRPRSSLVLQWDLGESVFSKISANEIIGYMDITFTRQP